MTRYQEPRKKIMKPAELLRELLYPLTNMATVMAMLFFWLIFTIAKLLAAMMPAIGPLIALAFLLLMMPAYFRYLLHLLEVRANGKQAPVPTAEMFSLTGSLWSLTPFVLAALLAWGVYFLSSFGSVWVLFYGIVFLIIVPASLAILAVTHSPIESLNPMAIGRMIQACGSSYLPVLIIVALMALLIIVLDSLGVPRIVIELGTGYLTILMFSLTGNVLETKGIAFAVNIGEPLGPTEERIARDLEMEREKVASHAYGFISRGNREGGFAHIMNWIQKEPDVHEASAWFFSKMMKWESKDAALFYAQTYLAHLLHHDDDLKALKLVSACLHEDPRWKPKTEDRQPVLELAEKHHRDDLVHLLRN